MSREQVRQEGKGTMAFHVNCYTQAKGRAPAKSFTARHDGTCVFATDGKCLHGGQIKAGEAISWARRGYRVSNPAQPTEQTIVGVDIDGTENEIVAAPVSPAIVPPVAPSTQALPGSDGVGSALAAILLPLVQAEINARLGSLDLSRILADIDRRVAERLNGHAQVIEVRSPSGETVNVGIQHKLFPTLLAMCAERLHVWLAGPAGSGKTTAAQAVAKALGLPFYFAGAITDGYALTGYNDAHGKYVPTLFRQAWEHGGVFLQDEVDGSDPNAVLTLNAALANGHAAFPDRVVERHADCIIIAAANTFGHGATNEYVGRLKLDGAFLDRFVALAWDYDDELERALCPNGEWCKYVQAVRARVRARGLRVLVTPRASYYGARLLAAGLDRDTVVAATLKKGMTPEQWEQVR